MGKARRCETSQLNSKTSAYVGGIAPASKVRSPNMQKLAKLDVSPSENDYMSNQICKAQNTETLISDSECVDDARSRSMIYMLLFSKSAKATSFSV